MIPVIYLGRIFHVAYFYVAINFSLLPNAQTVFGATQPSVQLALLSFLGVRRPGCEVDLPSSSVEVKNEWSCPPTTLMCCHVVEREIYILPFDGFIGFGYYSCDCVFEVFAKHFVS